MSYDISRRKFIKHTGSAGALALASALWPMRFAFAETPHENRLLVVILRGAMDGLAAVVPYADRAYADVRGAMALPQNAATLIQLDGMFAMHTALKPLTELYQQKQLLILHAAATSYRDRSHFDAQDLLENGSDKPHALTTGWLNRAVLVLPKSQEALAIGSSVPLMLRGQAKVGSWAPSVLPDVDEDFLSRVMHMYQSDPLLLRALTSAQDMRGVGGSVMGGRGTKAFIGMIEKAAAFMSAPTGARIGTIELGGWDTHANQGLEKGRLANNFSILADGLVAYKKAMGAVWAQTAVLVITEFGRTVKGNGTSGTDHGTGSIAMLLGGGVSGGRVVGDWPGLSQLYEDRDLMPVNDLRGLLKSTLNQHLGIQDTVLDQQIFPGSNGIWLKEKLFA